MKSRNMTAAIVLVAGLTILTPAAIPQQNQTNRLFAVGLRQLEAAYATNTDAAYQEAQESFAKVLAEEPDNPEALVRFGETKLMRAYLLAVEAKYGPSTQLLQSGMADIDRAISLAPNRGDLRLERGLSYGPIAAYINRSAVAREDLEIATGDPQFLKLPKDQRARAFQVLGVVYTNLKEMEKALDSFHAAIDADPDSRFAKDAGERIKTLVDSGVRPDRFPKIPADTSPLVAAVSITYQNTKPGQMPTQLQSTVKAIEGFPGLLAVHRVASMDKPGMFILFTWWKDKQSLNDFYYSDLHEGWMRGRAQRLTGAAPMTDDWPVSQLGIEVFGHLPGGIQVNGGFTPKELFAGQNR